MAILNTENGKVTAFEDSVTITDSGTRITAGKVEFYDQQNMAIIHGGNVNIVTPTSKVTADSARYLIGARQTYLYGNVEIQQQGLEVRSPALRMDNGRNEISTDTDVHITDSARGIELAGKTGKFNLGTEDGTISGSPELKMGRDKPMSVRARRMEISRTGGYALAVDDVQGQAQDANITADTLRYFLDQDSAVATGHPALTQGENKVTGERMRFELDSSSIRLVDVTGGEHPPRLVRQEDSLTGRRIVMAFDSNKISTIDVAGDSLIRPEMHQKANRAQGDSIRFYFTKDTMRLVRLAGWTNATFLTDDSDRVEVIGEESTISFKDGDARQVEIADVIDGRLYRHLSKEPGAASAAQKTKAASGGEPGKERPSGRVTK